MVSAENSDTLNYELNAHPDYAQILIEAASCSETSEQARLLIEGQGVHVIETVKLAGDKVLLKLNVKDMRGIALKLIEKGFIGVKGVNAIFQK